MAKKPVCPDGKCNGGETADSCPADCPSGGDDTNPLTATFRDSSEDRIMSDAFEPPPPVYIDGVDNVRVRIGNTGRLFINIAAGKPNKPPIRRLFVDFCDNESCDNCASDPLLGDPPCTPPFDMGFSVGPTNIATFTGVDLLAMPFNPPVTNNDLRLGVVLDLKNIDAGNWVLRFDPSDADCPFMAASTIDVTRTAVDTWVIEADADAIACLKHFEKGGVQTVHGLYHMPFQMTVSSEP